MGRLIASLLILASMIISPIAFADAADVGPVLRPQATALCMDDAMRLCPEAVSDETAMLTCMQPKRALLNPPCKKIFDEVVRDVDK